MIISNERSFIKIFLNFKACKKGKIPMEAADMGNAGGPLSQFREQLKQGKFMIQRSRSSGSYVFYPRVFMPGSGAEDLEWVPASGEAIVYATTVVYPRKKAPYNIAVIELAEGPRLMSRVVDVPPEDVKIGMKVFAKIEDTVDKTEAHIWTLVFSPARTPLASQGESK
jgi:uncharacterized OB-fold protein